MTAPTPPQHEIRALHTGTTVTVYQAYSPALGVPAARDGRFPPAWKRDRMTWIKPSFLWMMYRCGWAAKEGQETVLAVEISREGFDWALANAELSHYERGVHPDRATWQRTLRRAPARVQWDPERDLHLNRLPYRSLQLGLAGRRRGGTRTSGRWRYATSPRWPGRSMSWSGRAGTTRRPGSCRTNGPTRHRRRPLARG